MRYLLLTGISGAGKTAAIRYLEDMGAFCVDNLPPVMILKMIEAFESATMPNPLVALSVDVRSGAFFNARAVQELVAAARRMGYHIELLFLEATDDCLVARYKETRRDHPLATGGRTLMEAIREERSALAPLKESADYVLDTTGMKTRQMQEELRKLLGGDTQEPGLNVEIMSFGFKRGLPREADLVFDVRFLTNPFYIEALKYHTGLDADVRDFVLEHPVTKEFLERMTGLLSFLLPNYLNEGKHRLVIAIGCTGGAHRSVAITERLGAYLKEQGYQVDISHRDLQLEQAHWKAGTESASGDER